MEQFTLDGKINNTDDSIFKETDRRRYKNPVQLFGYGPDGESCKSCYHRLHVEVGNKHVYKCPEWILSHSERTDIRLKWPACGKWKTRETTKNPTNKRVSQS